MNLKIGLCLVGLSVIFSPNLYAAALAVDRIVYKDFKTVKAIPKFSVSSFASLTNEKGEFTEPFQPTVLITEAASGTKIHVPTEASSFETVLKRIIPGKDGRNPIIRPDMQWPYRVIAQLCSSYDGIEFGGTGTLVGPRHVLTVGHNVFSDKLRDWAKNILVKFSLDESYLPFDQQQVIGAYTYKRWIDALDSDYDVALLILDHPIGRDIGWHGLACVKPSVFMPKQVHLAGYPLEVKEEDVDKTFKDYVTAKVGHFRKMWNMSSHDHKVTISSNRLYYEIDTSGGQSGSGIFYLTEGNKPYIIGVHTSGEGEFGKGNYGLRINSEKMTDLLEWISNTHVLGDFPLVAAIPADVSNVAAAASNATVGGVGRKDEAYKSIPIALPLDPTLADSGRLKRTHDEAFKPVSAAGGAGARSFTGKDATEGKEPSPESKRSRPSDDALKSHQARKLVKAFEALSETEDKIKFLEAIDFSDVLEVDDMMVWLDRIAEYMQSDKPLSLAIRNLSIVDDKILVHFLSKGMQESFYNLRRLTLQGTNLSDAIFGHISRMPHLEYLDLSNNTGLNRFREGRLADVISTTGGTNWLIMPELVDLILNGCDELISIELNAPKLVRLDARGCRKLASLHLRVPTLQSVDFTGSTSITDREIGEIREGSPLLKDIEAMNTNANLYKIYNPKKFQRTSAWPASISHIGDYGIRQFALDLPGFTALEHLDLMNNDIGDVGISVFADAFRGNVTVKVLNLIGNPIGDLGIIALANVLASNNTLEELYLGGNHITDVGMQEVLNSIKSNYKLKKLQYDFNEKSSLEIQDAIQAIVRRNQTI